MESICIEDRKKVSLIGATKVISSTNMQAVVEINSCNLVISGTNIEVTKLDLENKEVIFSGNINSLKYMQKADKTPLLKRIFK
ncbi:MAG: hypothetical protein J6K39_03785 [Clostridia bacterium]|nr:hypothetical protein [Clostridia bacterium]